MPKRSPHPHVSWRGGRPRFTPGPELRAAGHKSRDLKHDDGRWFSFGEAIDWSREFDVARAPATPAPEARPVPWQNPNKKGYVYFLWAGDRIKIGFSTNPALRIAKLMTGVSVPPRFIVAAPGTLADEQAFHAKLRGRRSQGEWFEATRTVVRLMQRFIETGIGPLGKVQE